MHPDVTLMGKKEVTWWSGKFTTPNYIYDFERYLDIADIAADDILRYNRLNSTNHVVHPMIFGDGTPSTMFTTSHWDHDMHETNQVETPLITAKYLNHMQPDAKLLMILRNPVDVTYSYYKYFAVTRSDRGDESEKFHQCVLIAIETILKCQESESIFHCTVVLMRTRLKVLGSRDRICQLVLGCLQLGRYYEFINEWFKYFPREQFFTMQFEEYIKYPKHYIMRVWDWMGMRDLQERMTSSVGRLSAMNKNSRDLGPMLPETEKILSIYFRDQNEMLATLLNDEHFKWKKQR